MTERIPIILVRSLSVRKHSLKQPGALVVSLLGGELTRDGATVSQPILPRRFLIAIAANGLIDRVQAVDLLWGDRIDGGPNDVLKSVSTIVFQAREAGAALGLTIEVEWGIGWRCRPLRKASPVLVNDAESSPAECALVR